MQGACQGGLQATGHKIHRPAGESASPAVGHLKLASHSKWPLGAKVDGTLSTVRFTLRSPPAPSPPWAPVSNKGSWQRGEVLMRRGESFAVPFS
jgi:hypothetical protein